MRDMKFKALPSENAKPMGLGVAMKLVANLLIVDLFSRQLMEPKLARILLS